MPTPLVHMTAHLQRSRARRLRRDFVRHVGTDARHAERERSAAALVRRPISVAPAGLPLVARAPQVVRPRSANITVEMKLSHCIIGHQARAALGQIRPRCSIAVDGSLSPDSFRAGRTPGEAMADRLERMAPGTP
jgi:hypothetical protein